MSSITCPECGSANTPDAVFCAACGASLETAIPPPPPTETTTPPPPPPATTDQPPPPTAYPVERPAGVTTATVIAVVTAIIAIVNGAILTAITNTGGLFFVIGLFIAIMLFISGWGLLNIRQWSWYIALIASLFNLIIIPIGTILSIILLFFLFKTRKAFGL